MLVIESLCGKNISIANIRFRRKLDKFSISNDESYNQLIINLL
jgi:hypothetical protein